MPWWSVLVIGLGGILLGGSWSAYRQEMPAWVVFGLAVCGILSVVAAFVLVPQTV